MLRIRRHICRRFGSRIKAEGLAKLPQLLEELEANCIKNGIKVHWAETTDEANRIVLEIAHAHGVKKMVKGKSMVSEEMHFNHFMENQGFEVLETDLIVFIIE